MFRSDAVSDHLEKLGLPVPDELATVRDLRRALNTAATDNPVDRLAEELEAGTVTVKNAAAKVTAAATGMVVREKAREVYRDLMQTMDKVERRAAIALGDSIVEQIRPTLATAVAGLVAARDQLGASPNRDAILAAGPAAVAAWQEREGAVRTVALIRRLHRSLVDSGYGRDLPEVVWWVASLHDADDMQRATEAFRAGNIAGLVDAGYVVTMNTAPEAQAVAATVRSVSAAASARAKEQADAERQAHKAKLAAEREEFEKQPGEMRKRMGLAS